MKVSVNWIKSIVEAEQTSANLIPKDINLLIDKIGAQLGAVDEVVDVGKKYKGVVVAEVVKCDKHPNADKLSVCMINVGKARPVQVVCGAPNVAAGQLVVWIPPGVAVPSTFDKDPLVLEAREIRGVVSNGMIASPKELGISDEHEGILVIDKNARPGDDFAELYRMDDYIIDIENKMFTHRPDLFGMLGIARELAGIQGYRFKSPSWYTENAPIPESRAHNDHKLTVKNQIPKLVQRFCALIIKDVKVGPSPIWLQASLSRLGIKSINNIVDLTNFYMLLSAQPLHAYDYDKVKTGVLGIRMSKKGEELRLLGGKTIRLGEEAVVITDGHKPIGLGGIMGGADTEVDKNTKTIILECANFDMNTTRLTAMQYGLFTDAATRFTKNQSPLQNRAVIARAAEDILRLAGGRVCGKLVDEFNKLPERAKVTVSQNFINDRLGLKLSVREMAKLLENVEFKVQISGSSLKIEAPFWRMDIKIPEDIVEEIGRLHGYDHLPLELPPRDLTPAKSDARLSFKSRLRAILAAAGANEVLTYTFVDKSLLRTSGQDPKDAYHIRNALSPDLQYYRLSLTPSLLEKVHPNIKVGYDEFVLFEIGKGHMEGELDKEKLPKELERLSLVIASKIPKAGAPYFAAKKFCGYLLAELRIKGVTYEQLDPSTERKTVPYYDPARAANIKLNDKVIGRIGEFKPSVSQVLKLPRFCAGFDLHTDELMDAASSTEYQPLNRFPSLDQDLCLRSTTDLTYAQLTKFLEKELTQASGEHGYGFTVEPIDIFQRQNDKSHKQTTWRMRLWHPDRTLTTVEANKLLDKIAGEVFKQIKAERV